MNIIGHFQVFDYIDSHGRIVIQDWALAVGKRDRSRLDLRIDLLMKEGDNLFPRILQSTRQRHILEIAVNGRLALRPLLCRGPFAMRTEYTLLCGAFEQNRRYVPRDAPERAEQNRLDLIAHRERRCEHEPFVKKTEADV